MPLPFRDKPGHLFDNADSFAMVFDDAWRRQEEMGAARSLSMEERRQLALEACSEHPFMISQPATARQVADFRIRLLSS